MQLENSFTVPVPVEQAWQVLQDVQRITPCMPGATLGEVDGDSFTGKVKVKVGPIMLTYSGKAHFAAKDEQARTMTIEASGKETRGTGTAKATVQTALQADGASTRVRLTTDLAVTGKPAQFGRGVMAEVSSKLIDKFAACLAEEVQAGSPAVPESMAPEPVAPTPAVTVPAPAITETPGTTPAPSAPAPARQSAEAIDLLDAAGMPVAKRLAPPAVALLVGVVLVQWWRHRH